MNLNETYKKIPWVNQIPNILIDGVVSSKRLDNLQKEDQALLIFEVISSLNRYFGQMPGNPDDMSMQNFEKAKENFSNVLFIWLSGLCDLPICQIIGGLLDILNLKTEYQKWPPKSVIEFYAVCKIARPPYHEPFKKDGILKEIAFDDKLSRQKQDKIAVESLNNIYKTLGKNYIDRLFLRKKQIESKVNRSEKECKIYESTKTSIMILEEILSK